MILNSIPFDQFLDGGNGWKGIVPKKTSIRTIDDGPISDALTDVTRTSQTLEQALVLSKNSHFSRFRNDLASGNMRSSSTFPHYLSNSTNLPTLRNQKQPKNNQKQRRLPSKVVTSDRPFSETGNREKRGPPAL